MTAQLMVEAGLLGMVLGMLGVGIGVLTKGMLKAALLTLGSIASVLGLMCLLATMG